MELLICGTAASEGWPALFCKCEACKAALKAGGKNLRSRCAYQFGEKIRIDFGPDSFMHQQLYGLQYDRLRHLLISHAHWDHWAATEMIDRVRGLAHVREENPLHVYGPEAVGEKLMQAVEGDLAAHFLEWHSAKLWEPITLCDGVIATPLLANHSPKMICYNWLLENEHRRFLQGHDTGWWCDYTWEFLKSRPLDMVFMDCSTGPLPSESGHLGCDQVVEVQARLKEIGALKPSGHVFATHFSHNGGWLHDQLESYLHPSGIIPCYDGMRMEF